MTIKLTKTERELLERAARKPSGYLYAQEWWSTGEKGHSSHGSRATNAIRNLVTRGLAENLSVDSNSGPTIDSFSTIYSTEVTAKITDAGREAIR